MSYSFHLGSAHYDETSSHLHIVRVSVKEGFKRGLKKQVCKSKVFTKEVLTKLQSGRKDIFMTFGYKIGGFSTTRTIRLCHISGFGRLNEGFGDKESKMYIGDFVELVVFMVLTEDMNVQTLRKKAGVKYIRPKFAEEISDFTTTVNKIL